MTASKKKPDPNGTAIKPKGFSSPPCYAHEVDPTYFGAPSQPRFSKEARPPVKSTKKQIAEDET